MLIIAACVLLVVCVAVLFRATAHKTKSFWCAIGLLSCAAILVAWQFRALTAKCRELDTQITEDCRALASDLESDVDQYELIDSQPGPNFGLRAQQLQEIYIAAHGVRARWAKMCVPEGGSEHCLPPDLSQRTVPAVRRAAAAIGGRVSCAK